MKRYIRLRAVPMMFLDSTFVKYCLIGVVNTFSCFSVIFILIYGFKMNYMLSNVAGYGVGITVSFLLNKFGNFRSKGNVRTELPLFIAAFGVAYTVNLFVLWFSGEVLHADAFLAQLAAGAVYTVVFYLFMKSVVFTEVQCKN